MNKLFLIIIMSAVVASFTIINSYTPVDESSSIKFRIKNLGINVDGSFKGLKGNIEFDAAKPEQSKFDISVDVNTINTGIGARDNHLKKEAYFDVAKYSTMKFSATKVAASSTPGTYVVYGNLTIKNTTKAVSIPFTATPQSSGLLFKGEFKLNRRDYGVGSNSISMSDNLIVYLSVFAKKN